MASKGNHDVQETNLDEIEVDEDGNLRYSDSSVDERETDVDAMEIDDDGNLRIQSASTLLDQYRDQDESFHTSMDDLSEGERQSLQRRHIEKAHYSGDGMPEAAGMLAMESFENESTSEYPRRGSLQQGHDLHDIELSVFQHPEQGAAVHSLERGESVEEHTRPKQKGWRRILEIIGNFFNNASPQKLSITAAIAVVVIGVLLTIGLLPASFVYVEYYELALAKNRVSGKVDREVVYYPGCYLLTPDVELIRFKGTAHTVRQNLDIFTSNRLSFNLGISLQYFIKPEELGTLFTNYEHNYRGVIESMIKSTIKNTAVQFSLDNFRLNRSLVEQRLRQAVAFRLSGDCCPSCCPYHCQTGVDCRFCRLVGRDCSKGVHMEMRYFQMGAVNIPEEVAERFLRQTVLLIEAEKEVFIQKHANETKVSEKLQKNILNKANEIREAAAAEAEKIRSITQAEYEMRVQRSYTEAMKKVYQRLNVTQEDHKLSLMYLKALEDISDHLYNLNFERLTSFN